MAEQVRRPPSPSTTPSRTRPPATATTRARRARARGHPGDTGDEDGRSRPTTADDALDEDDETFTHQLHVERRQLSNAFTHGRRSRTTTPRSPSPISDVTVTEGNTGTVDATITVTLSACERKTVTRAVRDSTGTATEDVDYDEAERQPRFAPAETSSKTIVIKVKGDTLFEPDEKFSVVLTDPTTRGPEPDMRGESHDHRRRLGADSDREQSVGPRRQLGLTRPRLRRDAPVPASGGHLQLPNGRGHGDGLGLHRGRRRSAVFNSCDAGTPPTVLKSSIKVKGDTLDELNESFKLELVNPTTGAIVEDGDGTIPTTTTTRSSRSATPRRTSRER